MWLESDCVVTVYIDVDVVDMVSIAAATLDDNDSLAPTMAIYTASALQWVVLPKGISHFERLPSGL